jgi:hypothetical protein
MSTQPAQPTATARAVCLSLDFSTLGNSRKVAADGLQTEANKAYLTVTKRLFASEEFDAIRRRDSHTKSWLATRALPFSIFKKGTYLIPTALVADVEKRLALIAEDRKQLVAAFVKVYSDVVNAAAINLRDLFNLEQYPETHEVAAFFKMRWRYFTFDTPETLKGISKDMFAAEQKKAEAQWALCMDEARKVLRASMAGLVGKMADSLRPDEMGQDKTFRDGQIAKLRDFISVFKARDITDDAELTGIVETAKGLCRGLRAEDINTDKVVRDRMRAEFGRLENELAGMVIVKPKRAIAFEAEE